MMNNRYINSIMLSAIGDSLGWITEFEKSSCSLKEKYGTNKIVEFCNWEKYVGGRFNGYLDKIKSGSYSDDTQLLLSVSRSIKKNGNVDNVYFSKIELPSWLKYARGAGRTIKNAAKKIERKSAKWNNNFFSYKAGKLTLDYRDSGANGAAMRILPIVLANYNNTFEDIKENIFSNSIVTHGHPRAIVGAILYGHALDKMLNQNIKKFNFESYLTVLAKDIKNQFKLNFISKAEYQNWMIEWNKNQKSDFLFVYDQTVNEVLASLRNIFRFIRDGRSTKESLQNFGCFAPSSKGSGISTVIGGIYLTIKYYKNPEMAIIEAVNSIGSDTDSIAAFTGGLIGCLYDINIIPLKWKNVQDSEYLIEVANKLYKISNRQFQNSSEDQFLMSVKSLNEIKHDIYFENEIVDFTPLGRGIITSIHRQKAVTYGKYNLIIDVSFEIGQSCKFSKLLDINKNNAGKYFF